MQGNPGGGLQVGPTENSGWKWRLSSLTPPHLPPTAPLPPPLLGGGKANQPSQRERAVDEKCHLSSL